MAINLAKSGLNIGAQPVDGETYHMRVKDAYAKETQTGKVRIVVNAVILDESARLAQTTFPGYSFAVWHVDADPENLTFEQEETLAKGVLELAEFCGVQTDDILALSLPTEGGEKVDLLDFLVGREFEGVVKANEWQGRTSWIVDSVTKIYA